MRTETLRKLQACDDAAYCEGPANQDREGMMSRVRQLKPELEAFFKVTLGLEGNIQDASYLTGLYEMERIICIRFSNWGNLFTIWDDSDEPLTTSDFAPAIEVIEQYGFVHVDYDDLGELYEGSNEYFLREEWTRFVDSAFCKQRASWWIRYFDFI